MTNDECGMTNGGEWKLDEIAAVVVVFRVEA
jgi:hypothetical protein